ncbi:hypothetical protein CYMTET_19869 [Cymbomonas tetramitiformis]|uniref:Uncharacterized protein n=1 Tax=Cymbomonas tetramitiformis TaxID=36881 RepID=A0AAE0L4V4_9CHLO|nr:hypothetical protein CYMTET_19869 [Cymbomonas tetramitiformis]
MEEGEGTMLYDITRSYGPATLLFGPTWQLYSNIDPAWFFPPRPPPSPPFPPPFKPFLGTLPRSPPPPSPPSAPPPHAPIPSNRLIPTHPSPGGCLALLPVIPHHPHRKCRPPLGRHPPLRSPRPPPSPPPPPSPTPPPPPIIPPSPPPRGPAPPGLDLQGWVAVATHKVRFPEAGVGSLPEDCGSEYVGVITELASNRDSDSAILSLESGSAEVEAHTRFASHSAANRFGDELRCEACLVAAFAESPACAALGDPLLVSISIEYLVPVSDEPQSTISPDDEDSSISEFGEYAWFWAVLAAIFVLFAVGGFYVTKRKSQEQQLGYLDGKDPLTLEYEEEQQLAVASPSFGSPMASGKVVPVQDIDTDTPA